MWRIRKDAPQLVKPLPLPVKKLAWLALYLGSKVEEYEGYLRFHWPQRQVVEALEGFRDSFEHVKSLAERVSRKHGISLIIEA